MTQLFVQLQKVKELPSMTCFIDHVLLLIPKVRTRLCHVPKPADEYLNAGRHHWPIAQLVDWLLKSGLAFECPADAPDPVEASPWAKIMILGN